MVTLLIRVMTYHMGFSLINSHESSIRWLFEVTWQIKYIIFPLAVDSWHQTRKAAYLAWEAPTLKATWTFDRMKNAKSRENLIFPILIYTYIYLYLYMLILDMTNKADSVIIYIRRFSTQTFQSLLISCYLYLFQRLIFFSESLFR